MSINNGASLTGFVTRAQVGNSRWYGTALLSLLTTGAQTNDTFALLEGQARSGEDIPFHTHTREDESFYLLEGDMTFRVGDQVLPAKPGDFIFLPRNVRHAWTSHTNARFLVLISPAGFETSFVEFSEPAKAVELPVLEGGPPPEDYYAAMLVRENELGVFYDFQQASTEATAPA